jgi:hypothetical protein
LTTYTCKQCGKSVERKPSGEFERKCSCDGGIVAHLKATATGESKFAQGEAPH